MLLFIINIFITKKAVRLSTPASLSFKGQATKHTTVKWSIPAQHYNCSQNALRMENICDLRLMLLYAFLFLTNKTKNRMRRIKTPQHEMVTGIIHFLEPFASPAINEETSFTCRNYYVQTVLTVPFPDTIHRRHSCTFVAFRILRFAQLQAKWLFAYRNVTSCKLLSML